MARSLTQLFRGLPAPVHVTDPNVRRIFDAIYENLRGLKVDNETGQLYSAMAASMAQDVTNVVSANGGGTTAPSDPPAEDSDRKVGIGISDAAGPLSSKLVPNTTGTPLLAYATNTGTVASLKAGAGMAVTAPSAGVVELAVDIEPLGEGVHLLASSEAYPLGIKSLVEGLGVTLTDQSHSVLIELGLASGMTNAGGDSHPLLAVNTDPITSDQTMVVRGLRPGLGISMENDPEPAVDNADVLVSVDTSELEQTTFDAAGMTFLVAVPLQDPLMLVSLGAPAGCPFATGADAGSADTVARGDHTHSGLGLPSGTSAQILRHNGTAWAASDFLAAFPTATNGDVVIRGETAWEVDGLQGLVESIFEYIMENLGTVTPTASHTALVRTGEGVYKWAALGACS